MSITDQEELPDPREDPPYMMKFRLSRYRKVRRPRKFMPVFAVILPISLIVGIAVLGQFVGKENIDTWREEQSGDDNNNLESYQSDYTFQTIYGQTIKLSDHQGKVVIVFFFQYECPSCPTEADILAQVDNDFSSSQLYIVPICLDSVSDLSDSDLRSWLDLRNPNWPAIRDDIHFTYAGYFSIMYTPTSKILDKNGNIKATYGSDGTYELIKAEVNSLL